MRPAVVFDMDGTLADCEHRIHWIKGDSKKNWKKFFEGAGDDPPREEIVRLAKELALNNAILIASGRPESLRSVTSKWLAKYGVEHEEMYLRKNGDFRPDGQVKAEMVSQMKKDGFEPWLVVDDRQTAVDSWRALGLVCLQCDTGDY